VELTVYTVMVESLPITYPKRGSPKEGLAGVIAIDTNGLVMVRAAVPDTPLKVAVIVAVPGVTAVARPPATMVTFDVEDQVTAAVMSFVLWSA
jgi:hypothetical protein